MPDIILKRIAFLLVLIIAQLAACASGEFTPESIPATLSVSDEASNGRDSDFSRETAGSIPIPTLINNASGATISIYDFGSMILHAFVNPPEGIGTSTFIIEGDSGLVLIDSHYSAEAANAFRAYADSLGKPINRIYVTHEHPDHINGLRGAFADVDSYAATVTAESAAQAGIDIDHIVAAGNDEIDGIAYKFEIYTDAESKESLVIKLPEYGVMAVGDLVYNGYHMVLNRDVTRWIGLLDRLQTMAEFALILPGHGAPGNTQLLHANLDYLETAWRLYGEVNDRDAFLSAMMDAYPDHDGLSFLRLGAGRIYPKQS